MNQGKKRIKIELEDANGGKYNLSLEGNFSKDKLLRVMEFMERLDDNSDNNLDQRIPKSSKPSESVGSKIWSIISKNYPLSSFTSTEIMELYLDTYNEKIQLSIISTYLSRFTDKGKLKRIKRGKEWLYKIIKNHSSIPQRNFQEHHSSSHSLSQQVPLTVYDLPL